MRRDGPAAALVCSLLSLCLAAGATRAATFSAIDPSLNPWFPLAAVGRDGALLVVWEGRRGFEPDIYGQLRDADGAALWRVGGVPLGGRSAPWFCPTTTGVCS